VGELLPDAGYFSQANTDACVQACVEPVFGIIKAAMRLRQFLLRGLAAVTVQWSLLTMAWNIHRMAVLNR
jgi:hypothetical protein